MDAPTSRTVAGLLAEMAVRFPDREAIVDARRRLTFAQWRLESRRIAKGLYALGVRRGDHVAILAGNVAEWLIVDFAIASLGATMVSVNTWATRRELGYLLEHSDAKVLVHADQYLGMNYVDVFTEMRAAGEWPDRLEHAVCLGECPPWAIPYHELEGRGAEISDETIDTCERAVQPADVACLLYTSGSTSMPKGVPLQHYGLVENMWSIGERQHLTENDRLWLAVSLFWALGCENALFALLTHGGCIVLQTSFDAREALELIERERCTVFYGTPNMSVALMEHPDRASFDLSTLRTGVTIGTPEQIQLVIDLGATEVCNVYGLTETYGNAAVMDGQVDPEFRVRSVGTLLPGNEAKIVDPETGRELPQGEVGEIRVRGYVMEGYYKAPDKNAEAFDADGYFLTGDLGFFDEDGYLFFRGRHKEMIKTGGINVAPVEVEEILVSHDAVAQAYVVGLADDERDEIVAAVIIQEPGTEFDEQEMRAYCRERMASYKVPRRYRLASEDELPLTSTRKLQKLRLHELFD